MLGLSIRQPWAYAILKQGKTIENQSWPSRYRGKVLLHASSRRPAKQDMADWRYTCGFCHISGRKIMPGDKWDLDHLIPLHKGGEHRENNLAPAIAEAHRRKSAAERRDKAKADRTRKKHIGITRSKNPMPFGRGSRLKRKIGGGVVLRQMEDADS